jgi:hypothetical protein
MKSLLKIKSIIILIGALLSAESYASSVTYRHVSLITITNNSHYTVSLAPVSVNAPVPPPCGILGKPGGHCSYKGFEPDSWMKIFRDDKNYKLIWAAQLRLLEKGGNIDNFNQVSVALRWAKNVSMSPFYHQCQKVLINGIKTEDCPLTVKVFDHKIEFFSKNNLEAVMNIQTSAHAIG